MKKRITITIVAITMALTLASCGSDTTKTVDTTEAVVATITDASTDKPQATTEEKPATSIEETTEVTTETAASTEKPSEEEPETTEAPATEGTTSAPAKPESTTEAPKPKPESTTEAPKPEPTTTEEPKPEPTPSAPTTEEPKPEPAPSAPTTEEPKHEHSWVWVETKAAGKVWVVDQAAWTETIEHPEDGYWAPTVACNYCGECFTTADAFRAHRDYYKGINDREHAGAGHGTGPDVWIKTKDAWTETINHEEVGHWEETPAEGYYKCDCGATK